MGINTNYFSFHNRLAEIPFEYTLLITLFVVLINLTEHGYMVGLACSAWYAAFFHSLILRWIKDECLDRIVGFVENFLRRIIHIAHKESKYIVDSLSVDMNLRGISLKIFYREFCKHTGGIIACVKTINRQRDTTTLVEESIKIGSMMGLETSILDAFVTTLNTAAPVEAIQHEGVENIVPAAATLMTLLGKEVGDVDITNFLDRQAKNVRNTETLSNHVFKVLREINIIKDANYSTLMECNESVRELREDLNWALVTETSNAVEFCTQVGYAKLNSLKERSNAILEKLRLITDNKLRTQMPYTEILQILNKVDLVYKNALVVRQSSGVRVLPVAVCLYGPPQVGKSTLFPYLIQDVKEKLKAKDPIRFAHSDEMSVYYAPAGQFEYADGYRGHAIVCHDDWNMSKDNLDHPRMLTQISTAPCLTNQAALENKGQLFEAKLVLVTCNELPRNSVTINTIGALQERFPICVKMELKPGKKAPKNSATADRSYDWINFRKGSMLKHCASEICPIVEYSTIVDDVVERMYNNQLQYEQKLCIQRQVRHQSDEEGAKASNPFEGLCDIGEIDSTDVTPLENLTYDRVGDEINKLLSEGVIDEKDLEFIKQTEERSMQRFETLVRVAREYVASGEGSMPDGFANVLNEELKQYVKVKPMKPEVLRLSSQIATIGIANAYQEDVSDDMFEAIKRAYAARDTTSMRDVGEWINYLIRVEDGAPLSVSNAAPELHNFIKTLGVWKVDPSKEKEWKEAYARQETLCYYDPELMMGVVWSPAIHGGGFIIPLGEDFILQLEGESKFQRRVRRTKANFRDWWRRTISEGRRNIEAMRQDQSFWIQRAIESGVSIGLTFMPCPAVQIAAIINLKLSLKRVYRKVTGFRSLSHAIWANAVRGDPGWSAGLCLSGPVGIGIDMVGHLYSYIDDIADRLSQYLNGKFLQLCEYMGIDVSQIWKELISGTLSVAIKAGIFSLFCILLYVIYRIINNLWNKDKKPEKNKPFPKEMRFEGRGNDWYDEEYRRRPKKMQSRKQRVKQLNFKQAAMKHIQQESWTCTPAECGEVQGTDTNIGTYFLCGKHNEPWDYNLEEVYECAEDTAQEVLDSPIRITMMRDEYTRSCNNEHIMGYIVSSEPISWGCNEDGEYESKVLYMRKGQQKGEDDKWFFTVEFGGKFVLIDSEEPCMEEVFNRRMQELLKWPLKYTPYNFNMDIRINFDGGVTYVVVDFVCLNTILQGKQTIYTRASLKSINADFQEATLRKLPSGLSVDRVINHECAPSARAVGKSIVEHHSVRIEAYNSKTKEYSTNLFALGHKDMLIMNAHAVRLNDFVKFYKHKDDKCANVAFVQYRDTERDLAIGIIVDTKFVMDTDPDLARVMAKNSQKFPDISKYLLSEVSYRKALENAHIMCYYRRSELQIPGSATYEGVVERKILNTGEYRNTEYIKTIYMHANCRTTENGDCGSPIIITEGKYKDKLIGFHTGSFVGGAYGTILMQEDFKNLEYSVKEECMFVEDPWNRLIVPGTPVDLPHGPEAVFLGRYCGKTMAASNTSLVKWTKSPWSEEFEEQLAPGALDPYDERIEIELPVNGEGRKSLLLIPNTLMTEPLPPCDIQLVTLAKDLMVPFFVDEMTETLRKTSDDLDEVIDEAINGIAGNKFHRGLEVGTAAGIPWCDSNLGAKKGDYIEIDEEGQRSFYGRSGHILKTRIQYKLSSAQRGQRVLSLTNSKLKDAVIKLEHIKNGKTRVFNCVPVDEIISDLGLYGHFKEAYCRAGINLHHGIGINPHSLNWRRLYEYITKHPNVLDIDYGNYDKRIQKDYSDAADNIAQEVIDTLVPDSWKEARKVSQLNDTHTVMVDVDTVYTTQHGVKSGNAKTTFKNCKINLLQVFSAWIEITGVKNFRIFRENVSVVAVGDDLIISVSDEYAEKYNFITIKKFLESIGHTVTTASKEIGEDQPFCDINDVMFLKRTFRELDGMIVAPLLKRSLESPLHWTQNTEYEEIIWYNLIDQLLDEALLHGEEYFEEIKRKLSKGTSKLLMRRIKPLLHDSYECRLEQYRRKYYD